MLVCVWSNFCQDGRWFEGLGLDQPKQLSLAAGVRDWYKRLTCRGEIIVVLTNTIFKVRDRITMWKRLSSMQLDSMLRKASVARVNRRLRRYYLIVRLLPNVFALACLPLSSI